MQGLSSRQWTPIPMKKRIVSFPLLLLAAFALAACSLLQPGPQAPLEIKLIAFNDFHGNLKTPATRVPVPDATQPNGYRLQPPGGGEQVRALVKNPKQKKSHKAGNTAG